jgi:L-rhamnose mutarotase
MRQSWVMKLKPGCEAEYKKRHDELWPEMAEALRRAGLRNFAIYRYGLTLFAYVESDSPVVNNKPAAGSIQWKWWAMMAPLMEVNSDLSPVMEPLEEMFYFPG